MIEKISVTNFKSHAHTEIELGQVTALVGPNGCGKTSLLQAIHCLSLLETALPHQVFEGKLSIPFLVREGCKSFQLTASGHIGSDGWQRKFSSDEASQPKRRFWSKPRPFDGTVYFKATSSGLSSPSYTEEIPPKIASNGGGLASLIAYLILSDPKRTGSCPKTLLSRRRMLEFVVVAEAEADARLVCDLADRIFLEEGPDWIYEELLPNLRRWSGFDGPTYTRWPAIKAAMREHRARPHYLGYVQGKPQRSACAESRKAILFAIERQKARGIDRLVLAKDLDSQPDRREGMRQARDEKQAELIVVLATPNPKREAWVLNGFICDGMDEEQKLSHIYQRLGFDPCEEAHRLRYASRASRPERDPKRILGDLTNQNSEREERCWKETALATLQKRGEQTYLKEFLAEVKDRLLPLLLK